MTCPVCGGRLDVKATGRPPTYCSTRCRMRAHRAGGTRSARTPRVPADLLALPRWVRHDDQKRPLRADGRGFASTIAASTWASHDAAASSAAGVGLGFVLNGDGIVCLDLDRCLDGDDKGGRSVPTPAARRLLERLPAATFVETSRSGTGLHVWGRATLPGTGRRLVTDDGLAVEVYGTGRFIALGTPRDGDRLGELQAVVDELLGIRER